ncbi:MAG: MCE family protein [Deltaproteobacteria bacterium]|nr:MCE family protein [Deltaproteobacteria bacterium]
MTNNTEFKVGLFIIITALLILASIGYVAYKKDVFSKTYVYTLSSTTGENITEGTPVVFWGFNIGQVSSMELTDSGVLVQIKIPERNNRVIRAGSRFVLEKPLLSSSRIIVYTDNLNGLPLQESAVPELTVSDDINELIKRGQSIAEKLDMITNNIASITGDMSDPQGDVKRILKNADKVTALLAEKNSLGEMLMGNDESVRSIEEIIKIALDIAERTEEITGRLEALTQEAGEQLYGGEGILTLVREILDELTVKLAKVEITLDNLNKTSAETVDATEDLSLLREDVDETVSAIRNLVDDLDRMIPFKAESEIKLP